MERFSKGQLKALSDFFNMVAVAWFTGGVVAPFFAAISRTEKWELSAFGLVLSYVFLRLSLSAAKGVG